MAKTRRVENGKLEVRSSKQYQMTKSHNVSNGRNSESRFGFLVIRIFEIVSDFGIRIWNLGIRKGVN